MEVGEARKEGGKKRETKRGKEGKMTPSKAEINKYQKKINKTRYGNSKPVIPVF